MAWAVLAIATSLPAAAAAGGSADGHGHHAAPLATGSWGAWVRLPLYWGLMTVAMMVPSTISDVRYVACASLRRRRDRSIAMFATGFVALWLPGALAAGAVEGVSEAQPIAATIGAFAVAAGWEFMPWKRRALLACRRRPAIRSTGWNADRSAIRFGALRGWWCVVSCGPAMLAVAAVGHAVIPMLVAGAAMYAGKVAVKGYKHPAITAAAVVAAGALALLLQTHAILSG